MILVGALVEIPTFGVSTALIIAGIGLIAAGVMVLLSKPPKFDDFRESGGYAQKKASYLFDGPANTIREGGPVPVGYGRLLVGSQVIQTDYRAKYVNLSVYNTTKALI